VANEFSFDLSAASWRHGHADEATYVEALAMRLEKSLPGLVQVQRDHHLFAKTHKIVLIEARLSDSVFSLKEERGRFVAQRAKSVRGIVISTKELQLDEWLQELSVALSSYAREHAEAHRALDEFLL